MEQERLQGLLEFGWLSLNRDDFDRATTAAHEVLAEEPDYPDALLLAGLAALGAENPTAAENATKRLLEIEPNDSRSHLLLGFYSHQATNDSVAAERAFREAIRIEPENADYYGFLGQFLGTRKRFQEGLATAHKGLKLEPENLIIIQALQALYRLADDTEMADKFGAKALALAPEESANFLEAGYRLLETGAGDEASGNFREALRLSPTDGDSLESIAYEKVRTHPFFKNGIYLPLNRITTFGAVITPLVWWALSLLWPPFRWLAALSAVALVVLYSYTGLFHLCRSIVLRRLRSGHL